MLQTLDFRLATFQAALYILHSTLRILHSEVCTRHSEFRGPDCTHFPKMDIDTGMPVRQCWALQIVCDGNCWGTNSLQNMVGQAMTDSNCRPSQFTMFFWPHELQCCNNRVRSTNEAAAQQYSCWTTNSFPGSNGKSYFILNKSEWCAVKKCCFPTFLSTNTFPYLSQKCLVTWSKYWRRKRTLMWNAFAIICCIETRRFAWFATNLFAELWTSMRRNMSLQFRWQW